MCSSASNVNRVFRPAHTNQPNKHPTRNPLPPKNKDGGFYTKCDWVEGGIATPFKCNVYGDPWGTPSEK